MNAINKFDDAYEWAEAHAEEPWLKKDMMQRIAAEWKLFYKQEAETTIYTKAYTDAKRDLPNKTK